MSLQTGEKVFTSWKEIASFFGKGVRTVQRWESKFGLPISRPIAAKNVVLATESDLRQWIRKSSSQVSGESNAAEVPAVAELSARLHRLEEDTARLSKLVATFAERFERVSIHLAPEDHTASEKSSGDAFLSGGNLLASSQHFMTEKSGTRNRKR